MAGREGPSCDSTRRAARSPRRWYTTERPRSERRSAGSCRLHPNATFTRQELDDALNQQLHRRRRHGVAELLDLLALGAPDDVGAGEGHGGLDLGHSEHPEEAIVDVDAIADERVTIVRWLRRHWLVQAARVRRS